MSTTTKDLAQFYKNKNILVTGGTGSIGEKIVSALLPFKPKRIVVFSKDDSKQYLMQQKFGQHPNLKYYLGDIRDYHSVDFVTRGVDIVFHAAALKQVPICEDNPFEAVKTNVIGSENVIKASILNKIKKVINISTDKAVNPTNTMGATKLISEKLFNQANHMLNNQQTIFASVRFGNVIGSRGSVIPLFMDQLKSGEPLTITDLKMTRFFMTIPEAVHLTLKAGYYAQGGEAYIFKMKSIRLNALAQSVIQYANQIGVRPPAIKMIGIRPGEKLYEELMYDDETTQVAEDEELYVILPKNRSIPYLHFQPCTITSYRSDQVKMASIDEIVMILKSMDPGKG